MNNNTLRLFFVLFFSFYHHHIYCQNNNIGDIYGGYIEIRHIGSTTYHVFLHVYNDSLDGPLDTTLVNAIKVYNRSLSNSQINNISVSKIFEQILPFNPPCDSSLTPPTIRHTQYRGSFNSSTYSSYNNGLLFLFQNANRKYPAQNLKSNQDITICSFWSGTHYEENGTLYNIGFNSAPRPRYEEFPMMALCNDFSFSNDHFWTDDDGDSLAWSLYTPFDSSGINSGTTSIFTSPKIDPRSKLSKIDWSSGFNDTLQIPGTNSINHLQIDSITGLITTTPNSSLGFHNVGFWCREFKDVDNDGDKELIGSIFYDIALYVNNCLNTPPSFPLSINTGIPFSTCEDSVTLFTNLSGNQNYRHEWYFGGPLGNQPFSSNDTIVIGSNTPDTVWIWVEVFDLLDTCNISNSSSLIYF